MKKTKISYDVKCADDFNNCKYNIYWKDHNVLAAIKISNNYFYNYKSKFLNFRGLTINNANNSNNLSVRISAFNKIFITSNTQVSNLKYQNILSNISYEKN